MNAKAICALACLTGSLIPPGVLAQTTTEASITKGTITVPGKDIIFSGPLIGPLDAWGGFGIEVKLPQKDISAANCGQDNGLLIEMAEAEPQDTPQELPKDPELVKKKIAYYHLLQKLSKTNEMVSIGIAADKKSLVHRNGKLFAPWCNVLFSEFEK